MAAATEPLDQTTPPVADLLNIGLHVGDPWGDAWAWDLAGRCARVGRCATRSVGSAVFEVRWFFF
jgi:hypothetical protein